MSEIRVSWFAPPALAVLAQGHLQRAGIVQTSKRTESSDEQFAGLLDARFDVVVTAMDNVLGWNCRGHGHDFRIAAQVEAFAPVSLVVRPEIERVADLAARELLVDSPENGFVVVLLAMLRDAGVDTSQNTITTSGGVTERFEALMAGRGDATLLGPPFVDLAVARGMRRLVSAKELYPDFPGQGLVILSRELGRLRAPLARWLAALEDARVAARRDPRTAQLRLVAAGIPERAAEYLAQNVADSLEPARRGIDLLIKQRAALGFPGAAVSYGDVVDLNPIQWSGSGSSQEPGSRVTRSGLPHGASSS